MKITNKHWFALILLNLAMPTLFYLFTKNRFNIGWVIHETIYLGVFLFTGMFFGAWMKSKDRE
ncbi:MAG: hypothetical protein MI922_16540 [Bacteroidales bacterium]|nr:hypothetical protein [Bacteroidales bacterium]